MCEDTAGCLLFADEGTHTAEVLASLLGERGIGVTRSGQREEYFALLDTHRWRLLIINADDIDSGTLDVLSQSRRIRPEVPALVVVKRGDTQTAVQATKAGAADCIETPIATAQLLSVVDALGNAAGHGSCGPFSDLTRMERKVLGHILGNCTNRQIASLLKRSPRTIEVHRRHVMEKLNATNLVELVKQAMRAGMIDGRRRQNESPPLPAKAFRIVGLDSNDTAE